MEITLAAAVEITLNTCSAAPPRLQLDHIGSACQDKMEQQQLEMVLVMDLHYPAATATVVTARPSTLGCVAAPAPSPLGDPVLHVAFGGGPHLLLAACSQDTLVVASLEGLAAYLFHQQTSSCGGAHTPSVKQHTRLWHQVAAVHCGHAEVLAIRWEPLPDCTDAPADPPSQLPLAADCTAAGHSSWMAF